MRKPLANVRRAVLVLLGVLLLACSSQMRVETLHVYGDPALDAKLLAKEGVAVLPPLSRSPLVGWAPQVELTTTLLAKRLAPATVARALRDDRDLAAALRAGTLAPDARARLRSATGARFFVVVIFDDFHFAKVDTGWRDVATWLMGTLRIFDADRDRPVWESTVTVRRGGTLDEPRPLPEELIPALVEALVERWPGSGPPPDGFPPPRLAAPPPPVEPAEPPPPPPAPTEAPAPRKITRCEPPPPAPPVKGPASQPCEVLNNTSSALEIAAVGDATSTVAPGASGPMGPGLLRVRGRNTDLTYCFPGEKITIGARDGSPGFTIYTIRKDARPGGCRVRNETGGDLVLRLPSGAKLGEIRHRDRATADEAVLAAGEITVEASGGLAVLRCASGTVRVVTEKRDDVEELRFLLGDAPPRPGSGPGRAPAGRAPGGSGQAQASSFWLAWGGAKVLGHAPRGSAVTVGRVALRVAPDGTVSGALPSGLDLLLDAPVPERFPDRGLRVALPVQMTSGARVVKAEPSLPAFEGATAVLSALQGIAKEPLAWATPAGQKRPRPAILVFADWNEARPYGCFHKLRDLELVAVRTDVTTRTFKCGPYRRADAEGGEEDRWVERREQAVNVTVYEARTGRQLATRAFPKSKPLDCQQIERFSRQQRLQVVTGGEPDEDAIAAWIGEQ